MTRNKLLQVLSEINIIPIRENNKETIYQIVLNNEDMIELSIFEDSYEIEYFSLVSPDTYNSYTIASIKFDNI